MNFKGKTPSPNVQDDRGLDDIGLIVRDYMRDKWSGASVNRKSKGDRLAPKRAPKKKEQYAGGGAVTGTRLDRVPRKARGGR
jgi:hypothetical protein